MGYHYPRTAESRPISDNEDKRKLVKIHTYGRYCMWLDLVAEPVLCIAGPIGIAGMYYYHPDDLKDQPMLVTCGWPPIDLVARLCGSRGCNGPWSDRKSQYDEVPPPYWRRLLQWWGWILPGYSMGHDSTYRAWRVGGRTYKTKY